MLFEYNDDAIRKRLVKKYNLYYGHWKDLNLLVAVFAMIGLVVSAIHWEANFDGRGPYGTEFTKVGHVTDIIVFMCSLMGVFAILLKYYFESVW